MQPLVVTAAVIIDQGRILLTRRPEGGRHPGSWEFPGGKLEQGEGPEQALQRELAEELGVTVEVGRIFETAYHRYEWGPVLILAYRCRVTDGEIQNLQVAEHRWITPSDLEEYDILPADRPIVQRLARKTSRRD